MLVARKALQTYGCGYPRRVLVHSTIMAIYTAYRSTALMYSHNEVSFVVHQSSQNSKMAVSPHDANIPGIPYQVPGTHLLKHLVYVRVYAPAILVQQYTATSRSGGQCSWYGCTDTENEGVWARLHTDRGRHDMRMAYEYSSGTSASYFFTRSSISYEIIPGTWYGGMCIVRLAYMRAHGLATVSRAHTESPTI